MHQGPELKSRHLRIIFAQRNYDFVFWSDFESILENEKKKKHAENANKYYYRQTYSFI